MPIRPAIQRPLRVAQFVAFACIAFPQHSVAQAITGRIIDAASSAPLTGARLQVVTNDTTYSVDLTDGEPGRFAISVDAGTIRLQVSREGYQQFVSGPLQIAAADTLDLGDIRLRATPIPLDTVEAEAEVRNLYLAQSGSTIGSAWATASSWSGTTFRRRPRPGPATCFGGSWGFGWLGVEVLPT